MKLGVCIPYRDNGDGVRKNHLDRLVPHFLSVGKTVGLEWGWVYNKKQFQN